MTLHEMEKQAIKQALATCPTFDAAAKMLGINLSTLWRKRKEYGLTEDGEEAPTSVGTSTLQAISDEVSRARAKFPDNAHMLGALMEEVGELSKALLENQGHQRVYDEAKQVACVAIRIMEEGDGDYGYGK
jgi:hypothetical protein